MKTMHDFLVWYNNRDVVPFLDAIDKQFAFYKQQNIDMFKYGVSVPGLTLLYIFNELPSNTFTVFNQTNSDLHLLVKENIVGGPAIIFHRYHEKDITKIRGEETCRSIAGYDANALYLWALMQDMPTAGTRVVERKVSSVLNRQSRLGRWLSNGLPGKLLRMDAQSFRHQVNGRKKRISKLPVDGWCPETRTAY